MKKRIDMLVDMGYEDLMYFTSPEFDDAIIGVSEGDGCVVYSYDKMVECLMDSDCIGESEAREFIDYNTIRTLPYMGERAPIVVRNIYFEE